MKQTFCICIYSAGSKLDFSSGWNKISFNKKLEVLFPRKSSNFDEIVFPAKEQNQSYRLKVLPNVCVLLKKQKGSGEKASVGLGEKSYQPINGSNESRGMKSTNSQAFQTYLVSFTSCAGHFTCTYFSVPPQKQLHFSRELLYEEFCIVVAGSYEMKRSWPRQRK